MELTIREISEATGLTAHTLRYYERIGLLNPIGRQANGHRLYRREDLGWIRFIKCLREVGMPIHTMQEFSALQRSGDPSGSLPRDLFERHREQILERQAEVRRYLDVLAHKIDGFAVLQQTWDKDTDSQPARAESVMRLSD